jgi:hypothetical protein
LSDDDIARIADRIVARQASLVVGTFGSYAIGMARAGSDRRSQAPYQIVVPLIWFEPVSQITATAVPESSARISPRPEAIWDRYSQFPLFRYSVGVPLARWPRRRRVIAQVPASNYRLA